MSRAHRNLLITLMLMALPFVGVFMPMRMAAAQQPDDQPAPKLTKAPSVKVYVAPTYPAEHHEAGREATVKLSLELSADGEVMAATVTGDAQPGFDEAAREAALKLVFTPAEVDGVPAPVRILYRYRFTLEVEKVTPPPEPTSSRLAGRVVISAAGTSADSERPVAQARVSIPSLELSTTTDDAGRFVFEAVPDGVHQLRIDADDVVSLTRDQMVPADGELILRLTRRTPKDDVDEVMVVRVRRKPPSNASTTIATESARTTPGVMGDALAVVQNLPGVARAATGSGAVVVWGSAPAETRVYIDDVPVPTLYHLGGLRSVMNDSLVARVELVPGGFGAAYGSATGALVKVTTAPVRETGIHGHLASDFLDTSGALSFKTNPSEPHAMVQSTAIGGRVGYLHLLASAFDPDIDTTIAIPFYWDYAAKGALQGSSDTQLLVFGAADDLERRVPLIGAERERSQRQKSSFHRVALRHESTSEGDELTMAMLWGGVDLSQLRSTFGRVPAGLESVNGRGGLRAFRQQRLHDDLGLTLGVDGEGQHVELERSGTLSQPPREGDISAFGQPPGEQIASDTWVVDVFNVAGYVEADWRPFGAWLRVVPGLRLEPLVVRGNRIVPPTGGGVDTGYARVYLLASPRLSVSSQLSPRLTLSASGGLYQQPPAPEDLSAVFGNPTLGPSRAIHGTFGANTEPLDGLNIEAAGFYKRTNDLASRSAQSSPRVAEGLVQEGTGRSYGAQLTVRKTPWHNLSGWLSYSIMRSERRDHPGRRWRVFDFDQTHVLTAVLSYAPTDDWNFGVRARAATGYPRTPVVDAFFDTKSNSHQPVFGVHNTERLPTFFQLDLHAERTFRFDPVRLSIYLDVLNVTYQRNAEELVYSYDYAERDALVGLPTLAVLGARLEF